MKRDGNLDNWNKATKVSIEKNTKWHWIEVERICPKCENKYTTKCCKETGECQHKFCSRKCANGHLHTEETKLKISQSVIKGNLSKIKNIEDKVILTKEDKEILEKKKSLLIKHFLNLINYYLLDSSDKYCSECGKLKTFEQYESGRKTCCSHCMGVLVNRLAKINVKKCIKGTKTRAKIKDENGDWNEDSLKTVYNYYFIYKTTNLINGKYYIGMHATNNFDDGYLGSGKALTKAIEKYGKENFKREELEYFTCYKDLSIAEQRYVTQDVVSDPNSYNMLTGGLGGPTFKGKTFSEESKRKISEKVTISNKMRYDKIYNEYKEQILNLDIDFSSKECINEIKNITNLSSNYIIYKTIKKYIEEFKDKSLNDKIYNILKNRKTIPKNININ